MKRFLILLFIFVLLSQGCKQIPNEVLYASQIPPDDQLIKISAKDLARDFTRGKKRSLNQDNDADKQYTGKWLKVTGDVKSSSLKKDGFGYGIILETFGGDPQVGCIGNYEEKEPELTLENNQNITVVGKLVSGGNASTLYLNPCKFIK